MPKLVLVGESTAAEKSVKKGHKHAKAKDLAAERAVNVKDYLVRIRASCQSHQCCHRNCGFEDVETYLVPAGATSRRMSRNHPVDESLVKPQPRKSLAAKGTTPSRTVRRFERQSVLPEFTGKQQM